MTCENCNTLPARPGSFPGLRRPRSVDTRLANWPVQPALRGKGVCRGCRRLQAGRACSRGRPKLEECAPDLIVVRACVVSSELGLRFAGGTAPAAKRSNHAHCKSGRRGTACRSSRASRSRKGSLGHVFTVRIRTEYQRYYPFASLPRAPHGPASLRTTMCYGQKLKHNT